MLMEFGIDLITCCIETVYRNCSVFWQKVTSFVVHLPASRVATSTCLNRLGRRNHALEFWSNKGEFHDFPCLKDSVILASSKILSVGL